ncbi:alpha/beta hydrolase-fold protein [Nocardioides sp.]|uniref:alpha/beta hydrolase n=1 Tax=Nocardioides sp. TaxID=35761 RepID=UPI0032194F0E
MTPITRLLGAVLVAGALAAPLLPSAPAAAVVAAAERDPDVVVVRTHPGTGTVAALGAYARLMTVPSLDTGEVPDVQAPREGGGEACPPRRCRDLQVRAPRGVKVSDGATTRVLLPRGYDAKRNADKRYPVVFLWNGGQSTYDGWTFKTELTRMSRRWKAILVMPDGGFGKNAGFFSDWHDGSFDWETYHTKVVVPWVDKKFRTIEGARTAVGASMGGIGVMNYAAHNPGMFRGVLSISGALDTTTMATYGLHPAISSILGYADPDLRRIWGDPIIDRANWAAHNPKDLAPQLRGMRILIASGTGYVASSDEGIYSGTFEQTLWNTQRSFLYELTANKIPYTARIATGGVHNWAWFNDPLRWGVPKLIKASRGR